MVCQRREQAPKFPTGSPVCPAGQPLRMIQSLVKVTSGRLGTFISRGVRRDWKAKCRTPGAAQREQKARKRERGLEGCYCLDSCT